MGVVRGSSIGFALRLQAPLLKHTKIQQKTQKFFWIFKSYPLISIERIITVLTIVMYKDISFAIVSHSILGPHLGCIDRG